MRFLTYFAFIAVMSTTAGMAIAETTSNTVVRLSDNTSIESILDSEELSDFSSLSELENGINAYMEGRALSEFFRERGIGYEDGVKILKALHEAGAFIPEQQAEIDESLPLLLKEPAFSSFSSVDELGAALARQSGQGDSLFEFFADRGISNTADIASYVDAFERSGYLKDSADPDTRSLTSGNEIDCFHLQNYPSLKPRGC